MVPVKIHQRNRTTRLYVNSLTAFSKYFAFKNFALYLLGFVPLLRKRNEIASSTRDPKSKKPPTKKQEAYISTSKDYIWNALRPG